MALHMINRSGSKQKVKRGSIRGASRTSLLSDFFQFCKLMLIIETGVALYTEHNLLPVH